MSYATVNDLVKRFGELEIIQLTDRDNLTGAVDKIRAAAAIRDAVNLIHGYLAKRYTVPLDPVPPLVTRWACDLARWFLQPHDAPDQVKANYERTLAELRDAAEGDLMLEGAEETPAWAGEVEIVGPGRVFGGLKGF